MAYTRAVWLRLTLTVFVAFLGGLVLAEQAAPQAGASSSNGSERIASGTVLARVATLADATQSYALYLPSGYTPKKKWPIVYVFDPFARGKEAVELFQEGAEQYGYIVAGSNNSRNGPWKKEAAAAEAMFRDTQERLRVDERLVYFGGLSGGARVAAQIALLCKCAAGVFLNGAGFDAEAAPPADGREFAVFATTGTEDFNYPEVVEMDEKLAAAYPHWLRIYDGPHQWAPKEVASEALAWFRVVAEGRDIVSRDEKFLSAELKREEERAKAWEGQKDWLAAWREYRQAAATFDRVHLGEVFDSAAGLAGNKAVREGLKREKSDFEEQKRLSGEISSGLGQLRQTEPGSRETVDEVREKIRSLRERTAHEKQAGKHRVYVRALTGIFVQAMEAGNGRQVAKDYGLAGDYYELAAEAQPESGWALRSLAAARAQTGDRKAAFATLRKAKQAAKDQAAFAQWLEEEPAFEKLRGTTEFRLLSGAAPAQQ